MDGVNSCCSAYHEKYVIQIRVYDKYNQQVVKSRLKFHIIASLIGDRVGPILPTLDSAMKRKEYKIRDFENKICIKFFDFLVNFEIIKI